MRVRRKCVLKLVNPVICKPWYLLWSSYLRHQFLSARSSSSSALDHWIWPACLFPILSEGTRVFESHIKSGSGSHVKHWCLDCSSPMKGSEASSFTHILSSFCLVPVSLHLPCWHRTITSQRYFLNVSSWGQAIPCWGPAARVRGRDPHDHPCRATTQGNGWLLSKAWRMQVSIMAGEEDSGKNSPNDDSRLNFYHCQKKEPVLSVLIWSENQW